MGNALPPIAHERHALARDSTPLNEQAPHGNGRQCGFVAGKQEFQFPDEACRRCGSAEHDGAGPIHQHAVLGMPAHRLGQCPALNIAPDRNELIR